MLAPAHPASIFLIGPMGSGKTTVGTLLATAMRREFIDSDKILEQRTGMSVAKIFECEGEKEFRHRETQIIAELVQRNNIVLATGGGAVLDPENRRLLGARGTVIYLHASVDTQLRRLSADRSRPLLQDTDPAAVLTRLATEREPLYRELSDHRVNMDRLAAREACEHILEWLDQ